MRHNKETKPRLWTWQVHKQTARMHHGWPAAVPNQQQSQPEAAAESIHSCSTHAPPRNIVGHHQIDQPTTASQHLPPNSAPSPVPAAPESTSYRDRLNKSKHCSTRLALPLPSLLLPHHANSSPPLGGAHCNSSNDASAPCLLTGILLLPALLQCAVLPGCHTGSSSRSRCGEFPVCSACRQGCRRGVR